MLAHAPSVRRSTSRVIATVVAVVVLHGLALWVVQRSVLPVPPRQLSAPDRVSARLVPQPPALRQAGVPANAARPLSPGKPLPEPARRAAPAPTPSRSVSVPAAPSARSTAQAVAVPATALPSAQPTASDTSQAVAQSPAQGAGVASIAIVSGGVTGSVMGGNAGSVTGNDGGGAAAKLERPSSSALHLRNPQPEYPRLSRQRGEQGRVVVNVLIGVDGSAQQAELITSSGFDRLDQAALSTVRSWRYVPGKRAGVPEAMWFAVPIQFVIQ